MTNTLQSTIGVVIADDDHDICAALAELIEDHSALSLLAVAHSGEDAARLAQQHGADLVVTDVQMPSGGVEAISLVKAHSPGTIVAVFTAKRDRRTRLAMLQAGAVEVFTKGTSLDLAQDLADLFGQRPSRR
jgi:DNA-binding NarL/FixJ family response regulator